MILVDTDHLSVLTELRDVRRGRLLDRIDGADDTVLLPVVSVEEQLRGWLAQVRPRAMSIDKLCRTCGLSNLSSFCGTGRLLRGMSRPPIHSRGYDRYAFGSAPKISRSLPSLWSTTLCCCPRIFGISSRCRVCESKTGSLIKRAMIEPVCLYAAARRAGSVWRGGRCLVCRFG